MVKNNNKMVLSNKGKTESNQEITTKTRGALARGGIPANSMRHGMRGGVVRHTSCAPAVVFLILSSAVLL